MPPPLPITPGRPVSYRRYLIGAFEFYQDRYLEELELRMPRAHGESKHVVKTCKGDERMMAIRKTLNLLGYERSKMQRQFHESFIQAVALHLYKDDPDVDMQKIMSLNNWADLRQSVLCLTPRRFGKSKYLVVYKHVLFQTLTLIPFSHRCGDVYCSLRHVRAPQCSECVFHRSSRLSEAT